MSFLTTEDFEEIRAVVDEVVDTFANKAVVYKKFVHSISRLGKDENKKASFSSIALSGLVVWDDAGIEIVSDRTGSKDFADGYVLFSITDLATAGLFVSGNLTLDPVKDEITWDSVNKYVIGVLILGQLESLEAVCKVFFKTVETTK